MADPFEVRSAELMDPKDVAGEFVEEHTEHAKLASYSHTVVWGSRGSGKSMHFKYLEPLAQACKPSGKWGGDVRAFLDAPASFVGVFINCRDEVLNRDELRKVPSLPSTDSVLTHRLFERYLACAVVNRIATTICEQVPWARERAADSTALPVWISRVVGSSSGSIEELLCRVKDMCVEWLATLSDLIEACLLARDGDPQQAALPSGCPRLIGDVRDLCKYLQDALLIRPPFFLLFDEANALSSLHQRCVSSLMAHRSQGVICVKVASQLNGFQVGWTLDGTVDETHDFTTLDLDGLYTSNRQAYYKRLRRIASDRLARADVDTSIEEYLPQNEREVRALEEARALAEKRYMAIPKETRPRDKLNFVKKYAPALMFQEVLAAKGSRTYAGFDNLVHLSSGIVRSFLDCCSDMYAKCVEKHGGEGPTVIPVSVQAEVIRDYSDNFIQAQLVDKIRKIDSSSKEHRDRRLLHSLLQGLGAVFRARLLDKDSREPRIISVSLKDEPEGDLRDVLSLAEREAFLHAKWYRSKRGNRNLRCYVLNRRLCPHFNLDLTGFQGRIELSAAELEGALSSPDEFATTVGKRLTTEKQDEDVGQVRLFDW